MRRREFISVAVGTAATWPLGARAQQPPKLYRIAIVHPSFPIADLRETGNHPSLPRFFQELRRLGYDEGRNLVVERYSGGGRSENYAEVARNAVRANPDVVLAISMPMILPLKDATATVPIVGVTSDPIGSGLVDILGRPSGNITGVSTDAGPGLIGKRLEILREAIPRVSRVALLAPRARWDGTVLPENMRELQYAAQRLGITLVGVPLDSPIEEAEYRRVFALIAEARADALFVSDASENLPHSRLIVEAANTARLPAIYPWRAYVEIGGLMAYSINTNDLFRRAAGQVDQILKGAKPGNIPMYQPTSFALIVNIKTANSLNLTIPPTLLARADEVIE